MSDCMSLVAAEIQAAEACAEAEAAALQMLQTPAPEDPPAPDPDVSSTSWEQVCCYNGQVLRIGSIFYGPYDMLPTLNEQNSDSIADR